MTNKLPITEMLEEIVGELSCKGVEKAFTAGYILGFMEEVRVLEEASRNKIQEEEKERIVGILDEAIKLNTLIDESSFEYIRLVAIDKEVKERILSGNK